MKNNVISGKISSFFDFDKDFTFFVENEKDLIQRCHVAGKLYEREELNLIRKHSLDMRVFFDIGANVGNHSVFMSLVLGASKVYPFEANPQTCQLLKTNILLNRVADVIDMSYLGIGLGAQIGKFSIEYPQANNIGACRLNPEEKNPDNILASFARPAQISVIPLDYLSHTVQPDFIKIDVEGMELEVLKGAKETIARYKPKIFIEVDNSNSGEFNEWVESNNYEIIERYKRYPSNENYLISHYEKK